MRRFIHRSIREQLVAEHVAGLPAEVVAQELLAHVWYDPDWEYAAPAALAMHSQRDLVLTRMICLAVGSPQLPEDISAVDACWELREFLAAVALESKAADWSSTTATLISQARVDLVKSRRLKHLAQSATGWETSNVRIRERC